MNTLDRVTVNPAICLGQPTIRGMRITVSVILKQIASGMTTSEIIDAYPELEPEDIVQSLRYAAWLTSERVRIVVPHGAASHGLKDKLADGIIVSVDEDSIRYRTLPITTT